MDDRRTQIIDAGLALLGEEGLSGLTQPKIAARTGLRQSHLTYYYPTRADLLAAVARAAVERQAASARSMAERITSVENAAKVLAAGTTLRENTRVLVALNQAADREPEVRALFNELTDAFIALLISVLDRLDLKATPANADLVHGLFIGLSVANLATGRPDGEARSAAALGAAFRLLVSVPA
jgi:AcrR family transcriptional regulator